VLHGHTENYDDSVIREMLRKKDSTLGHYASRTFIQQAKIIHILAGKLQKDKAKYKREFERLEILAGDVNQGIYKKTTTLCTDLKS
jgi:hypothetical protein